MIATLTFAGLRIGELCALRWRDVDLAGGWLTVGESKTDAGRRRVKIRGALRDELLALRGRHQDARRTPTCSRRAGRGGERGQLPQPGPQRRPSKRANESLAEARLPPLPEAHAALAAADVLLAAVRARRGPRRRHGRNGPHRPGAGAARLPPGDAPRRGREGAAAGARGRRRTVAAVTRQHETRAVDRTDSKQRKVHAGDVIASTAALDRVCVGPLIAARKPTRATSSTDRLNRICGRRQPSRASAASS